MSKSEKDILAHQTVSGEDKVRLIVDKNNIGKWSAGRKKDRRQMIVWV